MKTLLWIPTVVLMLPACGLSRKNTQTAPQQMERFDRTTRTWVPINAASATAMEAPRHRMEPEPSTDTAKVLGATPPPMPAPQPGGTADTATANPEPPGMLKRAGQAATAPLRWLGLGKSSGA